VREIMESGKMATTAVGMPAVTAHGGKLCSQCGPTTAMPEGVNTPLMMHPPAPQCLHPASAADHLHLLCLRQKQETYKAD
jgi:hypothetical protein